MSDKVYTLRELIDEAQFQLNTYKHPRINDVKYRLDEILRAANMGSIGYDTIVELSTSRHSLTIGTEYMVQGCRQIAEYILPLSIIDAADPIYAAKVWSADQDVAVAERAVEIATRNLDWVKQELEKKIAARKLLSNS